MDHLSSTIPWFANPQTFTDERAWQTLIKLSIMDMEVGFAIAGLPWIADGLTGVEDSTLSGLYVVATTDAGLARLALDLPWVTGEAAYTGDETYGERSALYSLNNIAEYSPDIARHVATLSWMNGDLTDAKNFALQYLADLAALDIEAAWLAANLPFLTDGEVSEDDRFVLRSLRDVAESDVEMALTQLKEHFAGPLPPTPFSEASNDEDQTSTDAIGPLATIDALPWIADGITGLERDAYADLVEMDRRGSARLLSSIISRPWARGPVTPFHRRIFFLINSLAYRQLEAALLFAEMPFLDNLQEDDEFSLELMDLLARSGDTGKMLEHEEFLNLAADEEADQISGPIARIILEVRHPEEAAAINAFPWVQDGISVSESLAMRTLTRFVYRDSDYSDARYYSNEVVWALIEKPLLEDGLTNDEVAAIHSLQELAQYEQSNAFGLLPMPFLESVDADDLSALSVLSDLSRQRGTQWVQDLLSHPALEGGITDGQAAIIADSLWQIRESLEVLDELFNSEDS